MTSPKKIKGPFPEVLVTDRQTAGRILSLVGLRREFGWVVSIGDRETAPPMGFDKIPESHRLRLEFDDVSQPHFCYDPPSAQDIEKLVAFAQRVPGKARVLVHCAQGISRSSAAALAIIALREGPGKEIRAVDKLFLLVAEAVERKLRFEDSVHPNFLMVRLADERLERHGALVEAVRQRMLPQFPFYGQR